MTLGNRIKDLLNEFGWSQGKLAKKTGIPRPTITAIANDKYKKVNLEFLFKIAQAFGIPPEELLSAAGYIVRENRAAYDYKETPEQVLEDIKLRLLRLGHMLEKDKGQEKK